MISKPTLLPKLLVCSFLILTKPAVAQITPDDTLGAESSRFTPNVQIQGTQADRIDGGAQRGGNLFHSFSDFNVIDGQKVYFVNPSGVENILSRVTGGNVSNILGTLGVDGTANLFLLNPNGIIFGPNASLDVRGSFVGTTANGIGFGEQGFFSATDPSSPPILTVNPSALLFTQLQASAGITNQSIAPAGLNSEGDQTTGLRVPDGKSLLLVGGNVNSDGGGVRAYGGRIELAGLSAPGSVGLNVAGNTLSLNVPNDVPRADVSLTNNAAISVFGAGGGDIAINARNLEISNSFLFTGIGNNLGNADTQTGDIQIATGSLRLTNGAFIASSTSGQGDAGNITLVADDRISFDSGSFVSSETLGQGDAGNITLVAGDRISFDNNSFAASGVLRGAVGKGGDIQVTTGTLSLNRAQLITNVFGEGDAGNITVNARDAINLNGIPEAGVGGIQSTILPGGIGKGGDIQVSTGSLWVTNGALLSTVTSGQGNAGNIIINARDLVTFEGKGNGTEDREVSLASAAFSGVVNGVGNGGDIHINSRALFLKNGGRINTIGQGQGKAGRINIDTRDTASFDGVGSDTLLGSGAYAFGENDGGDIQVTTGTLSLTNGGTLFSSTSGNAGKITINARDAVNFNGVVGNEPFKSGVFSLLLSGGVAGKGGDIGITTNSLSLTNGAQINASAAGNGDAGKISLKVNDAVLLTNSSGITASVEPGGVGKAGNIDIQARSLSVVGGSQIASSLFRPRGNLPAAQGRGGNIQVNTSDSVTISGVSTTGFSSGLITNTGRQASGNAGDITVSTGNFKVSDGAIVLAGTASTLR